MTPIFSAFVAAMAARIVTQGAAETAVPPVVAKSISRIEMKPSPIEPSWIISGAPRARVGAHSEGADGQAGTCVWDCTAGEFRWHFGWDETVFIVEGLVRVTGEDGATTLLQAGDIAFFRAGSQAVWRIDSYVRKVAFCRRPFPAPVAWPFRLRQALRRKGAAAPGL